MEQRLLPINALLGLLLPNEVTPPALSEAGFALVGLEVPAGGPDRSVMIDAVLLHADTSHLLVVEAKSGANVENLQAEAYAGLRAPDVVQSAYVTLPQRVLPTIEVVYLCLAQHLDRVRLGLDQLELKPPIISVSDTAVMLDGRDTASEQLRAAFPEDGVALRGPPPRLILFDQDSDEETVKPRVLSALVAAMARRQLQIGLATLAEQATPHFALYGRRAQNRIKRKVAEAAGRVAEEDPATFQFVSTSSVREGLVRILRTPEDNDLRGRTQAYQAVGRPAGARRRRPRQEIPGQLDLLAALEPSDNDDTEESATEEQEGER